MAAIARNLRRRRRFAHVALLDVTLGVAVVVLDVIRPVAVDRRHDAPIPPLFALPARAHLVPGAPARRCGRSRRGCGNNVALGPLLLHARGNHWLHIPSRGNRRQRCVVIGRRVMGRQFTLGADGGSQRAGSLLLLLVFG
eukprot:1490397-Prymnesium_polylepis.1